MGGKGSGRRKGDPVKPPPRETTYQYQGGPARVEEDINHRSIKLGQEMMFLGDIENWGDISVLEKRFKECLEICDKWHIKPIVSNIALGFGITSELFVDICQGRMPRYKGLTRESFSFMQKIYAFLKQNLENNLIDEKGNPVKWIFLGKNYFGLTDQVERVVKHVDEKPELPQGSNVTDKYASLVGRKTERLPEAEVVAVEDVPEIVVEESEKA